MVAELLKNPALFSIMNADYISSLPAPVKRRLKALKKIQLESTKIEAKFYEEVHKLECKYHELYQPLYQKRSTITKGEYEWPSDDEVLEGGDAKPVNKHIYFSDDEDLA